MNSYTTKAIKKVCQCLELSSECIQVLFEGVQYSSLYWCYVILHYNLSNTYILVWGLSGDQITKSDMFIYDSYGKVYKALINAIGYPEF